MVNDEGSWTVVEPGVNVIGEASAGRIVLVSAYYLEGVETAVAGSYGLGGSIGHSSGSALW